MAAITHQGNDRVKRATPTSVNKKIENDTWQKVAEYSQKSSSVITDRIHQLENYFS